MPESFLYNPCITNKVMQGAFFPVKRHHQIANSKGQGAGDFGQAPGQGSWVGDLGAVGANDLASQAHFTRCGSVFADKEDIIAQADSRAGEGNKE